MTLQLIGTDALADNAVSTDKSQPFGNIILNSSAAGTDVGDRILLDRTNANGQDAGDAINVEKEILDIEGINVASRKQLKLGAVILESGTTDTVDGDVLLLDSTASGVDEGEMILYNETFNPATFNIGGTFSAGQAIKVNSAGSGFEFGAGGKILQWVRNASLTNVNTNSAGTSYQSLGNCGTITPVSNDSTIYVVHNLFALPYHSSGTNVQIGVGFEMYSDSGLSSTLSGTYGNTHTIYLQTGSGNSKYIYLPMFLQYAYATSSADGHPGVGSSMTYYHACRNFNNTATPYLRVNNQNAYIIEVD